MQRDFLRHERRSTAIEYGLLAALILLATAVSVTAVGQSLARVLTQVAAG